ncbi:MAG: PEGA domain-containing protein [Candidatus Omnitrophica bacterium]|nr:PEGA domain-containing protein [Candidatus Omnitrophota bacterium]
MFIARKITFYVFLAAYCILCPLIIFYSFGYILHPIKKEISHTGLIHLATIPSGADVYLENSRFRYKTPTSITELLPGKYKVTVRLKGFRPWRHRVTIEEGKASAFNNILLVPAVWEPQELSSESKYASLMFFPESGGVILKKGAQLKDFYGFDRKKEKVVSFTNEYAPTRDFAVSSLYLLRGGKSAIVYGGSLWDKKFYLIDLTEGEKEPVDITKLISEKPDRFLWRVLDEEDCFAVYNGYVNRVNFREMSLSPRFINEMKGFGASGRWLYVLEKNNSFLRTTVDLELSTVLFEGKYFGERIFDTSRSYRVRFLDNDVFLFWGDKGDLIVTIPPHILAEEGVKGVDYNKQRKRLLYWTNDTIWVADFTGEDDSESLFQYPVSVRLVYSGGRNIAQCFWVHNGTHILYRERDRLFLLELMSDEKHHLEYIVRAQNNSDIFYSDEDGYIYYLDQNGGLKKLKILLKETMIPFAFGEKERQENR